MNEKIIAIDFDGTLTLDGNSYPLIGEPRLWLINKAKLWKSQGHKLILWTCRTDVEPTDRANYSTGKYLTDAVNWCSNYGLTFDSVNANLTEAKYPNIKQSRKVYADIYLDDKSVHFNDTNLSFHGYSPLNLTWMDEE